MTRNDPVVGGKPREMAAAPLQRDLETNCGQRFDKYSSRARRSRVGGYECATLFGIRPLRATPKERLADSGAPKGQKGV